MRKIYLMAAMLLNVTVNAQQRTFTKSVSANYATKQVSFNISWAADSRGVYGASTYNSKVWVLIDYQEVRNGVPYGNWQRATIDLTKLPANCSADGTNAKGFWYQGQAMATQNANLTITLAGVPAQFKWCAFASDCPPNAIIDGNSYTTLKGSPPFIITYTDNSNDTKTTKDKYRLGIGKTIRSITDATNCPGSVFYTYSSCSTNSLSLGNINFISSQTWVFGGQTWSAPVNASACQKTTYNGGSSGNYNADCRSNMGGSAGHLFSWCAVVRYANMLCPSPWRVPTTSDFANLDQSLGGSGVSKYNNPPHLNNYYTYWSAENTYVCDGNGGYLTNEPYAAQYWSSDETVADWSNWLRVTPNYSVDIGAGHMKSWGQLLRCVK